MNTPETINIEKYAEALNNLVGMDIGYLGESDKDVNAIVEVIVTAKKLENRVKELTDKLNHSETSYNELYELTTEEIKDLYAERDKITKENRNLEYTLLGVMHSVDKWLDGEELEMDEVNRAATMREKTLQIVENLTEKWEEAVNQANYIADVTKADMMHKIQARLEEKIDRTLDVFDFNISECNAVRQVLRGVKDDIYQVVKELMEGEV